MEKQFAASEVRRLSNRIPRSNDEIADAQEALRAFADLLEAREKAVPVAYAAGLEANMRGFLDVMAWPEGEFTIPLYTHAAPADTERLAEALERTARHRAAADRIDPDQWRSVLYSWEDRALAAHSAQAQLEGE